MAEVLVVVGLFDSRADADRAADRAVRELGLPPRDVVVHSAEAEPRDEAIAPPLLLSSLPAEDHGFYEEGLRRGGVPVAVLAEDATASRVVAIFGACGAIDLQAREAAWRAEGWTGRNPDTGYTGHDEDIGFATYGGDAVFRRIPKRHHDDTPAGWLGRLEMAAAQDAAADEARHARRYVVRDEARRP
ncbi:hypothetical protein [Falsiroseomonas sp.]|uniref:hypothetical protein n=1 Tax=Falsiroseomonas sp. TaxID=2870721 RepID=UPI003568A654